MKLKRAYVGIGTTIIQHKQGLHITFMQIGT